MSVVIVNTKIMRNKNGLFRISDLHKAAGGDNKHKPKYWLENKQTKILIDEILTEGGIPTTVVRGGKNQGTYVCKELVYAYAMWISPKFNLHVIRIFDAVARSEQLKAKDREIVKLEYKPMTDAIKLELEAKGKTIKPYHFSNEADLINKIALGMTAAKFKAYHEMDKNDSVRDYLTQQQLKCVTDLQRANTAFIQLGMDYDERKEKLTQMYQRIHVKPLIQEQYQLSA